MKLDKSDFEDINEDNKWPIAFEEISNYYNKALNFFNVCEEQSHFFDEKISKKLIYWPKNKKKFSFKSKFLKKIIKRKNLNLFLENELTSIEYSENFNHIKSLPVSVKGKSLNFMQKNLLYVAERLRLLKFYLILRYNNLIILNFKFRELLHGSPNIKTNNILIKKTNSEFLINKIKL